MLVCWLACLLVRSFVFFCVFFLFALFLFLQEYFLSEDAGEVLRSVRELKSPAYHYEIVKRGINMSLDARDHEVREVAWASFWFGSGWVALKFIFIVFAVGSCGVDAAPIENRISFP